MTTDQPTEDTTDHRQAAQEAVQAERGPIARAASPNPNMVKALLEERKQLETRTDLDERARDERIRQVNESLKFYGHGGGDAPETDAEKLARKHGQPPAGAPADDNGENARLSMIQGLLEERSGLEKRVDLDDKVKADRIDQVNRSLNHYGYDRAEHEGAAEKRADAAGTEETARKTPPKTPQKAADTKQTRTTS